MKKLVAVLCAMNIALMLGWTYDRSYYKSHSEQASKSENARVSSTETVVEGDLRVTGALYVNDMILSEKLRLKGRNPQFVVTKEFNLGVESIVVIKSNSSEPNSVPTVNLDGVDLYVNNELISSP